MQKCVDLPMCRLKYEKNKLKLHEQSNLEFCTAVVS